LGRWQQDPELASVRDATALAKLSPAERAAWQTLWSDVAALRQSADDKVMQVIEANNLAGKGLVLLQQKKWGEAESVIRACLALREKVQPDAWNTFNSQVQLGGALLGQNKFEEAEPLLRKGYEGMKQREKTIPLEAARRITEALDRLIELAVATNKPDEANKWRAERAKYSATRPAGRR
jgi:hypothetical protein